MALQSYHGYLHKIMGTMCSVGCPLSAGDTRTVGSLRPLLAPFLSAEWCHIQTVGTTVHLGFVTAKDTSSTKKKRGQKETEELLLFYNTIWCSKQQIYTDYQLLRLQCLQQGINSNAHFIVLIYTIWYPMFTIQPKKHFNPHPRHQT